MTLDNLLAKVHALQKTGKFDLSREEDLSIAIMNLISLEEHFFMTAQKTGKKEYLDLHQQTRQIRTQLLAQMIPQHEGETWCISKHLLATTMRLIEVGDKHQSAKENQKAKDMFDLAYQVYSMFWAIRLKLINFPDLKQVTSSKPWTLEDITTKLVDCCKE